MSERRGYKRVHFFKVFLTEDDWNARHRYHIDKYELHNKIFHGDGILPYEAEGFLVAQQPRSQLAVEVRPGYAIDGQGRDIIIRKMQLLRIDRALYTEDTLLFVIARVELKPSAFVRFPKTGERINRFFDESAVIELTTRTPGEDEIELARIFLTKDSTSITDAAVPRSPQANEIDLRFRRISRVNKAVDGDLRQKLLDLILQRQHQMRQLAGNTLLRPAIMSYFFLCVLEQLIRSNIVTPASAISLLGGVNFNDIQVARTIENNIDDPWIKQRPEFQKLLGDIDLMRGMLDGPFQRALQDLDQIASIASNSSGEMGALTALYGNDNLLFKEVQDLSGEYKMGEDWEHIKVWSGAMPPTMIIDGLEWQLIDAIDVMNEESELVHNFRIAGAEDAWRNRQRLTFPDGVTVDETGVGHKGGFAEYEVKNITADMPLAIVRMMDYARADYELQVYANNEFTGVSHCVGSDQQNRWRNWPFVIPAAFVSPDDQGKFVVRQQAVKAEREINMFKYWFYQPTGW
jgi:hypothetical protein